MNILLTIENSIGWIFSVCYAYQFFFVFYMLLRRKRKKPAETDIRQTYGVVIAARNEENVIGHLIDSVLAQNYPQDKIRIFVVADNCTDHTADVARAKGARVLERENLYLVGKGYALDFLFKKLLEEKDDCDAYIVFDADNLVDPDYIAHMNRTMSAGGYVAATSYRNSKNYDTNWISAGYSLWFLREAKYLNNARYELGSSCSISGTGFCLSRKLIEENNGWKYHLLTEDVEFSVDTAIKGEKIAYCGDAIVYDEQPVTFRQSWNQRLRWAKGFYQVLHKYGLKLTKGIFTRASFSCFDMLMNIFPAIFLTVLSILLNLTKFTIGLFNPLYRSMIGGAWLSLGGYLLLCYALLFIVGLVTVITEWKNIRCSVPKKILYTFTFPLFMLTYIPIALTAIFKKVGWTPIKHTVEKTMNEMK